MKKLKICALLIMLIAMLVMLVGCDNSKKNEKLDWLKDMENVSYIKLRGASGNKTLDNELAKIILETYKTNQNKILRI